MSKSSTTTALALLLALLLCISLSRAARLLPTDAQEQVVDVEQLDEMGVEGCEKNGEEECLMRRTLAAHLDYIYTQDKQH